MTTPAPVVPPAVSGTEDVPLATVKNVGSSEILATIALVASLATALFGHDFGITKNAQLIAQVAVFIIPMATGFARSHKHRGIALANAQVIIAQIEAASKALVAAQQTAPAGTPTPQSATTSAPSEPGGPTVTYGYSPDAAEPGRHAATDVGADLPVVELDGT